MTAIFIAFTGVHGSGKTTIVNSLAANLRSRGNKVTVIKEGAREYTGDLNTFTAQNWLWNYQLEQEAKARESDADYIIADRTVMDSLMYHRFMIDRGCNEPLTMETMDVWCFRMAIAQEMMGDYDCVIRMALNLDWLQSPDPLRSPDVRYAAMIDRLFDEYVEQYVNGSHEVLGID